MNLIYKIMNFLHTYISFIHVLNSFVCRKYRTDYTVLLMYSTVVSLPTPPYTAAQVPSTSKRVD